MPEDERYLSMAELTQRFGLTRYAFYCWMKQGRFPVGFRFGKARRWPLSQVREWEEAARIREAAAV